MSNDRSKIGDGGVRVEPRSFGRAAIVIPIALLETQAARTSSGRGVGLVLEAADVRKLAELLTGEAVMPAVRDFAAEWRDLMAGLPDDYTCTLTCAEANAAAGLYRALGEHAAAASILAAHAAHDQEGDEHFNGIAT